MLKKVLTVVAVLLMMSGVGFAESIVFYSGKQIDGQIVEKTDTYIKADVGVAVPIKYYLDEIDTIDGIKQNESAELPADDYIAPVVVEDYAPLVVDEAGVIEPEKKEVPLELFVESENSDDTPLDIPLEKLGGAIQAGIEQAEMQTSGRVPSLQQEIGSDKPLSSDRDKITMAPAKKAIPVAAGAFGAVFALAVYIVICLPVYMLSVKTKIGAPILAFIPILNIYLLCMIGKKPGWWVLLHFIPIVNIVIMVLVWVGIAETCEKPSWVGILILVPFVNIGIPWYLAFGAAAPDVQPVSIAERLENPNQQV